MVKSKVTMSNGEEGEQVTQCFEVPFTILDVDECAVESGEWAHQCREPSVCVNTLGSYECVCPLSDGGMGGSLVEGKAATQDFWNVIKQQSRSAWEVSLASSAESSCPDRASTYQCCDADGHSKDGAICRSSFVCPRDPCAGKNKCDRNASCECNPSPLSHPNYECACPKGTLGNGRECTGNNEHKPKVKFDGVTPTEETEMLLSKGLICGCVVPVVDVCSGFKCTGELRW